MTELPVPAASPSAVTQRYRSANGWAMTGALALVNSLPMFSYRVDKRARAVFTIVSGVVRDEDVLDHVKELVADSNIEPGSSALIDFRHVTRFDVTPKSLWQTAEIFRRGSPFAKTAFVVDSDVIYGMGRMYQMIREQEGSVEIRVFRDLKEAKDWLRMLRPRTS